MSDFSPAGSVIVHVCRDIHDPRYWSGVSSMVAGSNDLLRDGEICDLERETWSADQQRAAEYDLDPDANRCRQCGDRCDADLCRCCS